MSRDFSRGAKIRVTSGAYAKKTGVIDSHIFGPSVDHPDEIAMGYGVVLDDGDWILVRYDQVRSTFRKSADHRGL